MRCAEQGISILGGSARSICVWEVWLCLRGSDYGDDGFQSTLLLATQRLRARRDNGKSATGARAGEEKQTGKAEADGLTNGGRQHVESGANKFMPIADYPFGKHLRRMLRVC